MLYSGTRSTLQCTTELNVCLLVNFEDGKGKMVSRSTCNHAHISKFSIVLALLEKATLKPPRPDREFSPLAAIQLLNRNCIILR